MTSHRFWLAGLLVVSSTAGTNIFAAEVPSVAETMRVLPKQKDVEYETPKESEYAKCKVEVEKNGKSIALVVVGPTGQILRKFLDTDGDQQYDQFRFYNLGIEVYRDIDTNKNNKIDQYRWLNRGGSRWGIDKDEDLHIDQWKVLSAAEASREAIRAMISQDANALKAVMITADDLKQLGVNAELAAKLIESAGDADKKAKAAIKNSKVVSAQSAWARFEAQLPSIIPVEEGKAKDDMQVYESAYAIIETPKKDGSKKADAVQIGEMIRVGEVWKLTQVPVPMESDQQFTSSPILMEPLAAALGGGGNAGAPNPKVQKLLTELQEIDQKVMQPNQAAKQIKSLMVRRAALFKEAIDLAETTEEKVSLMKQNIDLLAIAAQAGTYPDGASDLLAMEAEITKKPLDSTLLPYTVYRRMQAEYSVNLEEGRGNKKKQDDVHKAWLQALEDFVGKYPAADDADDALMALAQNDEFQGKVKEATAWYQKIVKDKPKSKVFARAQGALRRLSLDGQMISLDGPLVAGGSLNVKDLKDKVVLIVFWNSGFEACEEDLPQIRALYRDNKKNGFEVVGVALESDKKVIQDYVKKHELTWPQIFQPSSQNQVGGFDSPIAMQYGIISLPTMFLIGKDGRVVSRNANLTEIKTELPGLLTPKKKP